MPIDHYNLRWLHGFAIHACELRPSDKMIKSPLHNHVWPMGFLDPLTLSNTRRSRRCLPSLRSLLSFTFTGESYNPRQKTSELDQLMSLCNNGKRHAILREDLTPDVSRAWPFLLATDCSCELAVMQGRCMISPVLTRSFFYNFLSYHLKNNVDGKRRFLREGFTAISKSFKNQDHPRALKPSV